VPKRAWQFGRAELSRAGTIGKYPSLAVPPDIWKKGETVRMDDGIYRFWLHQLPGVGDRSIERLLAVFGSEKAVCLAGEELKKVLREKTVSRIMDFNKNFDARKAYAKMREKKISFYTAKDREYPERLRKLSYPPYGIYCMGNLPENRYPAAAIIGAREYSEYGRYMAQAFAGGLAEAGVSVVSGMARGIDGIGQQAALKKGGRTYAVLGCGVDICYPASNKTLYQEIIESGGGILSVFPPGTPPAKGQFPERNRIVAGLSDLVLVVEARQKSGTLITVDMALEQGKHVYAVPGRLTDRLSDGCNLLIRQGAGIALAPRDLLAELKILDNRKALGGMETSGSISSENTCFEKCPSGRNSPEEKTEVLDFLDYHPKSADEILERIHGAGHSKELPELLAELVELCMEGKATQTGGSYFFKNADLSAGDEKRFVKEP